MATLKNRVIYSECATLYKYVLNKKKYIKKNTLIYYFHMDKAHKNCTIGTIFCLHHITGTAFINRFKLYVYIVENSEMFKKMNVYFLP